MKVLLLAPHPDDESIAMGGFLSKYGSQCDVICVNSSGYARPEDTVSAEEIADVRIKEFHAAMEVLGVKTRHIVRIFGKLPHFEQMMSRVEEYKTLIDFSLYDVILLPDPLDSHREHRFVTNHLVPLLMKGQKVKSNALVAFYPVWGTVTAPNYFEDISQCMDKKEQAVACYKSRMHGKDNFWERTKSLNYFYGFLANYKARYAEALHIEPVTDYLQRADDRDWARYM